MEVLDRMPWAAKDSVFHRLAQIAEVSNLSKEERIKYDSALRHYRDTISVLKGAEEKGMAKGVAKGISEGEKAKGMEIAKKMKAEGFPTATISRLTGLTPNEIQNI